MQWAESEVGVWRVTSHVVFDGMFRMSNKNTAIIMLPVLYRCIIVTFVFDAEEARTIAPFDCRLSFFITPARLPMGSLRCSGPLTKYYKLKA